MNAIEESRSVTLRVPARPDFVVLARLALSAVARLTPLEPDDVADLKLAVTEAASGPVTAEAVGEDEEPMLVFGIELQDDALVMELEREPPPHAPGGAVADDRELSRAIVEATVDECHYRDGGVKLVKYFAPDADSAQDGR